MAWKWHKVMKEELAQFVTADAMHLVVLDLDREELLKQRGGRKRIVQAIYEALAQRGVRYTKEKYTPESQIQMIRTPEEVLGAPREGTCLDLASLFCGVCEGAELLPMLIILKEHAVAAVALKHGLRDWDAPDRAEQNLFENGALRSREEITRIVDGEAYIAVECTGFTRKPKTEATLEQPEEARLDFDQALQEGKKKLEDHNQIEFAVDIGVARYRWLIDSMATEVTQAVANGFFVEQDRITAFMADLRSAKAADFLLKTVGERMGAGENSLRQIEENPLPECQNRQVAALMDARQAVADQGLPISPDTEHRLGLLAAFRRDYENATVHLRRAVEARPKWPPVVESFLWLQQSRAIHDISRGDTGAAKLKLLEAQRIGNRAKIDLGSTIMLQGFVEKSLAQVAEQIGSEQMWRTHLRKASSLFEAVVKISPEDPGARNGLANTWHMLGDLEHAEEEYHHVIRLAPEYAAPRNDLAILYEQKATADPANSTHFLGQALQTWCTVHPLAEADPSFSQEDLKHIRARIATLGKKLGPLNPREMNTKGAGTNLGTIKDLTSSIHSTRVKKTR